MSTPIKADSALDSVGKRGTGASTTREEEGAPTAAAAAAPGVGVTDLCPSLTVSTAAAALAPEAACLTVDTTPPPPPAISPSEDAREAREESLSHLRKGGGRDCRVGVVGVPLAKEDGGGRLGGEG